MRPFGEPSRRSLRGMPIGCNRPNPVGARSSAGRILSALRSQNRYRQCRHASHIPWRQYAASSEEWRPKLYHQLSLVRADGPQMPKDESQG
jgi:hypothetical protein